ncbi:glycosyltransferase family 4 protein [Clostridium perfringens]|nr:glycosyltransferase family 4 protein [Clostridium perfringens]
MKIVIDLTSLDDNFSGIERFALNISKSFIEQNIKNEYILVFKNKLHDDFKEIAKTKNVYIKIIKGNNKLFFSQIKLPFELYKLKADKYLFLAFPAPLLFFKKGIINTIHDMTAWLYPETMSTKGLILFKTLIYKSMFSSERIFTVSNSSKQDICSIFPKNKIPINIIYNGLDKKFLEFKSDKDISYNIRKKYRLEGEYILCLGTIEPRKNIGLLIDSYIELVKEKNINYKLVLVGRKGWKYNSIIKKIKYNKLENKIIFTGFVDDIDLPYVYSEAKCFVFPSIYEGFGIPIIEAMSVGVPVIASNTSSIPEVLDKNGLMFKSDDKEDLKNKLIEFLSLPKEEVNRIKINGNIRAKQFRWDKEIEKLNEYL